jgi:hypothetical protein
VRWRGRGGKAMSYDIFLSYSRTDKALAERFIQIATERGLNVWYDQLISGGLDWRDTIVEALRNSKALVILFSESSNTSRQLIKELAIADSFSTLVIPVLIENTEPRGAYLYEMASRNWINLYPDPVSRLDILVGMLARQLNVKLGATQFIAPRPIGEPPVEPEAPQASMAASTRDSRPAADVMSKGNSTPWFPLGRFDLLVLAPLLIYSFVRELNTADHTGLGLCAIVLCLYMLLIAKRNASLNRSIFSMKSFVSYAAVTLFLFPFGYLPDVLKEGVNNINRNYLIGAIIVTLLFAIGFGIVANILQFVLRKIFQKNVFRRNVTAPLAA